jgi:hypothetical protein
MVDGFIASLNVAVTETFLGTPVAELAGPVDDIVGTTEAGGCVGEFSHAAATSATVASTPRTNLGLERLCVYIRESPGVLGSGKYMPQGSRNVGAHPSHERLKE